MKLIQLWSFSYSTSNAVSSAMQRCSTEKQMATVTWLDSAAKCRDRQIYAWHSGQSQFCRFDFGFASVEQIPKLQKTPHLPTRDHKKKPDFGSKRFKKAGKLPWLWLKRRQMRCAHLKRVIFLGQLESIPFQTKKTLWIPCIKSSIHLETHRNTQNSNEPLLEHFGSTQIAKWIVH